MGILIKLVVAASDRYISSHNATSLIFMVMGTCKNTSVAQVGHIRRWHWGNKFFCKLSWFINTLHDLKRVGLKMNREVLIQAINRAPPSRGAALQKVVN